MTTEMRSGFGTLDQPDPPSATAGAGTARPNVGDVAYWGLLAVALTGWIYAVAVTHTRSLGDWGLLRTLPLVWYVSVALVVILVVSQLLSRSLVARRAGPAVFLLATMLYATTAAVEPVPQFPWVYKHIGVTNFIGSQGRVNVSSDIYNRWPGFFAFSAFLARATGFDDPVRFAAWAEPLTAVLALFLVVLIARTITANERTQWAAASFFAITGWVGQYYFSPQSAAYVLYLGLLLLSMIALRGTPVRAGLWLERQVERVCGAAPTLDSAESITGARLRRPAMVAFAATMFAIAASHQLTPYVLLAAIFPLGVLGLLRPKSVGLVVAAITLGYLAPNFSYVQNHFRVVRSVDVVGNATSGTIAPPATDASTFVANLEYGTTALIVAVGAWGLVRRVRAGHTRSALLVAWMAAAPSSTLLVQSYGGEGRLRVVLFALPFLSIAAAWAFCPGESDHSGERVRHLAGRRRGGRLWLLGALVTLLTTSIVPELLQPVSDDQISPGTVAASKWLDQHAGPHDLLVSAAPNLVPFLLGRHYGDYITSSVRNLSQYRPSTEVPLTPTELKAALVTFEGRFPTAYLVFSPDQSTWDARHGLFTVAELDVLQAGLPSIGARIVYDRGGTRVYRLPIKS